MNNCAEFLTKWYNDPPQKSGNMGGLVKTKLATKSFPLNRLIGAFFLMPIISINPRIFINGFDISVNRRKAINHMP